MSKYELIDYDRLLYRIGIPNQQDWRCGNNEPVVWNYEQANLSYDDIYDTPNPALGQPFGAKYDGRAPRTYAGLCLGDDINLNGLLLNHRDRNGTIWLCTEIEGWWTLPPSEIPDVPRPYWDGSMLTTGRYLMRTITVSGCFIPPDPSLVWYNRDLLIRVGSIVRGVGLIAVCGNADPAPGTAAPTGSDPAYLDPFYDPPKMSIIQTNDVPLIETIKPNGFTQFSLSFRCVQPTKQSVGERQQKIPAGSGADGGPAQITYRMYKAFSSPQGRPGETGGAGEPEGTGVTSYLELGSTTQGAKTRSYSDVQLFNVSTGVEDEDIITAPPADATVTTANLADQAGLLLNNKGNYFAFPIYVFNPMTLPAGGYLELANKETNEIMQVVKPIPAGKQLVVDTNTRRCALIDPGLDPPSWIWDARSYLSLGSSWVTLAAGPNQMFVSGNATLTSNPTAYWRDTWIG